MLYQNLKLRSHSYPTTVVKMNDAVIEHHFDEVFTALQDIENFEIFTRAKKGPTPRIHRTIVKIVDPAHNAVEQGIQTEKHENIDLSQFASRLKSMLTRSTNNTPVNSRPTSSTSTKGKIAKTPSKTSDSERLIRTISKIVSSSAASDFKTSTDSSRSSGVKKLFSSNLMERENSVEMKNSLFECKYCKRFILGDFIEIHEANCGSDTL